MRLDLSREQIQGAIWGLECHISMLTKDMIAQKIGGLAEDTIKENLTVEKSTMLYLKDFLESKK